MRQRRRAVDDRRHPDSMSHSVRTSTERTPAFSSWLCAAGCAVAWGKVKTDLARDVQQWEQGRRKARRPG